MPRVQKSRENNTPDGRVKIRHFTVDGDAKNKYITRKTINNITPQDLNPEYTDVGCYFFPLGDNEFIVCHNRNDYGPFRPYSGVCVDYVPKNPAEFVLYDGGMQNEYDFYGDFFRVKVKSEDDDTLVDLY